ncbi:hypothetical protein NXW00_28420 [Bacteroides thetaiotaomicron]|nr:hypothetical protein [Bacteroides thetaiotaomicron]
MSPTLGRVPYHAELSISFFERNKPSATHTTEASTLVTRTFLHSTVLGLSG